jgi:hypothetical protein
MPSIFSWNVPNKQLEISCVADDYDDARRKAIEIIQKLEHTSHEVKFLSDQRKKLIVQLHSAAEDRGAAVSTFSPPTKEEIRQKIVSLNLEIDSIRSRVDANIYLGMTSLIDLKYTPDGDDKEMSLVHVVLKTEPTVNPFYPITIKRIGMSM